MGGRPSPFSILKIEKSFSKHIGGILLKATMSFVAKCRDSNVFDIGKYIAPLRRPPQKTQKIRKLKEFIKKEILLGYHRGEDVDFFDEVMSRI
jgi:hypothetical protein